MAEDERPRTDLPQDLPDREQRCLITRELERNILVEAAAGTGKTASMVGRMVALLRTGACGNIAAMAAVTFTRKAAAELRGRFQVALEKAVREAEGEEKGRLEAALAHSERCFVGTIHSFCARLLRERPVEAGVDLAFEEMDEDADRLLREEAWEAFTAGLAADDPHGFLDRLGFLGLSLADLGGAFSCFSTFPDVDDWPLPGKEAELELARAREGLRRYVAHMSKLSPRLAFDCGTDTLVPNLLRLPRIVSHYDELGRPDQLMEVLERFDRRTQQRKTYWQKNGGFTADEALAEKERWERFREDVAAPALRAWRELRYAAVMDIMPAAREVYDALRRERGQLDFQDLLMRAAALLRDNPAVRRYFQARFTHLLVDEFQDTDPIQAEVIFLLCAADPDEPDWRACTPRPGSLFLVGDPKQSIYRFRRADIVTYNEAKGTVLAGGGLAVELQANFRATAPIVAWVNRVFEPGEPAWDDSGKAMLRFPARDTEQSPSYVPLFAGREEGTGGELNGIYRLLVPAAYANKTQAVEYEADLIARFIRHALDTGMTVPRTQRELAGGKGGAVEASDFMIVTRTKSFLGAYAQALQGYGVPHRVTGGGALNELRELRLLYVCLRAVVHPEDPVALVAALRSELFGLSDPALYAYRKAGGSFSYNAGVPDGLEREHAEAFADAFARLKSYSLMLSRLPHAAACERIAADLGLPALAASRPGGDVQAGSLCKAIELLRGVRDEMWSAAQLVAYLARLVEGEETHDGVSALSGMRHEVRIMNLHKVKGLEAPVVFLADASGEYEHPVERHVDRSGGKVLGYLAVSGGGGFLAHPAAWESLAERERGFRRAEALRLRYVAATRSGAATIVTQRVRGNAANPWCFFEPYLDPQRDLPDPGPQEAPVPRREPVAARDADEAAASISRRLAASLKASYDARGAKEFALSHPGESGGETSFLAPDTPAADEAAEGEHGVEWGEVMHILLRAAMDEPDVDLRRAAAAALAEHGLDPASAETAVRTARAVMGSPLWERAAAADERFTEVPFQVLLEEGVPVPTILRGVIDLAFRERGGWVLVDYKTDAAPGGKVETLARRYGPQLALYARAWEGCSGEAVREALLYFVSSGTLASLSAGGDDGGA